MDFSAVQSMIMQLPAENLEKTSIPNLSKS